MGRCALRTSRNEKEEEEIERWEREQQEPRHRGHNHTINHIQLRYIDTTHRTNGQTGRLRWISKYANRAICYMSVQGFYSESGFKYLRLQHVL